MSAVTVPAEARELVAAINARGQAFWDGLGAFNASQEKTGAKLDALMDESDQRDAMIEQLRKRHFPRAAKVTVDQWGVYTWSPTGRIVRKAWSIPQDGAL